MLRSILVALFGFSGGTVFWPLIGAKKEHQHFEKSSCASQLQHFKKRSITIGYPPSYRSAVYRALGFKKRQQFCYHRERPVGFEGFEKTFFLLRKTFFYAKKAYSWKGGSNLCKFGSFSSCRFSWKILFFFFTITPPFLENPLRAAIICKCLLRSFTFPVCRRGE